MILSLKRRQVDLLKEEAEKVRPVEAVALLFGELTREEIVVRKAVVTPNALGSAERFEVNPEIVVAAIEEAEKEGYDFIGLFHSHPAPANPSMIDLESMKRWGEVVWLILSSIDGELAAYQISNDELREMALNIE